MTGERFTKQKKLHRFGEKDFELSGLLFWMSPFIRFCEAFRVSPSNIPRIFGLKRGVAGLVMDIPP